MHKRLRTVLLAFEEQFDTDENQLSTRNNI